MNKDDKITMDKYATGEIVAVGNQSVKLVGNPQDRLKQGKEAADALMSVAKPKDIQGKPYLTIKDWQTIGSFYGLFSGAEDSEPVNIDGVAGFKAKAVVRTADGTIISAAVGYCLDEGLWKGREKFAQASMAQTRASAKALRLVVGWVAHLAGYEDTPAEEMDFQDRGITQSHAQVVSQNGAKTPKNGLICPLCKKGVLDQRVEDIDGSLICPTSKKGRPLPAFKCVDNDDYENPTCKFASWKLTEAEAGVVSDIVEDENIEEAEELAKQAEEEELPF